MDAFSAPWLRRSIDDDGILASSIHDDVPISYLDTATLAERGRLALETEELRNGTLPIGGPRPMTHGDLLPLYERLTGTDVTSRNIPLERIEPQMATDVAAMARYFKENRFAVENDYCWSSWTFT